MKNLTERISYLKGLCEGMNVMESGPQGRIIVELLDVISDFVDTIDEIKEDFEEYKEYVESIDDDLLELEEDVYCDGECDGIIEVNCQNCGEEVFFESDLLDDDDVIEVICPKCNEVVYINDGSFDFEPSITTEDMDSQEQAVQPNNIS